MVDTELIGSASGVSTSGAARHCRVRSGVRSGCRCERRAALLDVVGASGRDAGRGVLDAVRGAVDDGFEVLRAWPW